MLGLVLFFLCTIQGRKELLAHYVEHEESAALQDWTMMVEETKKILGTIKSYDAGRSEPDQFYRISRSLNIDPKIVNMNLYRNEALAHTYNSLSHYSSTPDESTLNLLGNLGYNVQEETVPIINTSVLPADSLLATKYITTTRYVPGLKKIGENIYENPFALPVALSYPSTEKAIDLPADNDPFGYSEYLYSILVGEPIQFYQELEYESNYETNDSGDVLSRTIMLQLPTNLQDYPLFLNTDYLTYNERKTPVSQTEQIACAGTSAIRTDAGQVIEQRIFSEETFLLDHGAGNNTLVLSGLGCNRQSKMSFAALNLEKFDDVVQRIKNNSEPVNVELLKNGRIELDVEVNKNNENLLLSVPYDTGWTIKINGKTRTLRSFEGTLITIPLEKGHNRIVLKYRQKGTLLGIILTLIGVILFILTTEKEKFTKRLDKRIVLSLLATQV